MPSDLSVPVTPSPFVSHRGETPITLAIDAEDAIRVEVLRAPEVGARGFRALLSFAETSQSDWPPEVSDLEEGRDVVEDVRDGRTLWQSAEILDWVVRISGVERILTHQLVRQRVGVTYSQQCTGDRDCRHEPVVVPRAYAREGFEDHRRDFVLGAISDKLRYSAAVDAGLCIGEARRCLPQCLGTFINVKWSLNALQEMYRKRRDSMTQDWLMYVLAGKIRDAVVAASPWMEGALREAPARGSYYERIKTCGHTATHLWSPKGTPHDDYPWNPGTFQHGDLSHEELSSGPRAEPALFDGKVLMAVGVGEVRRAIARIQVLHAGETALCEWAAGLARYFDAVYPPVRE